MDNKNVDQDGHVIFFQMGTLYFLTLPVQPLKTFEFTMLGQAILDQHGISALENLDLI